MTTQELYVEAFREVGKEYGYENVSIEWTAFKQFKVQWQRSYNWIAFRLSDYLKDAPVEIVKDLAKSLFAKIKGEQGNYSQEFADYVLSPQFSQTHRQTFIRRGRYLTDGGEHKTLTDSIDRLVAGGFIPADHNIKVVWNNDTRSDMAATHSVLMRTVMVSSALDSADTPDHILDYVVYHQYLRIREGTRTFGTDEQPSTREDEKLFPQYREVEKELDNLCLCL